MGISYLLVVSEDLKFREVKKPAPGHMGRLRRPLSPDVYSELHPRHCGTRGACLAGLPSGEERGAAVHTQANDEEILSSMKYDNNKARE